MKITEAAFLRVDEKRLALGLGPFASAAEPPIGQSAFYIADFAQSDPRPWKIPRELRWVGDLEEVLKQEPPKQVRWNALTIDSFAEVYHEVGKALANGERLEKIVPVVTQRGRLRRGDDPLGWARQVARSTQLPLWSYAYWNGRSGFTGASPEPFLMVDVMGVKTIALAGTTKPAGESAFEHDEKQIREHEFVVEHALDVLRTLGQPTREPRETLDLGEIMHFQTLLSVKPTKAVSLNKLIQRLHPTPALGAFPCNESTVAILRRCRAMLNTPDYFGAPFGLWHEGRFHSVVAIRGLAWSGLEVFLPSGCGLVAGSDLETEWQELSLKRQVVKSKFGLE